MLIKKYIYWIIASLIVLGSIVFGILSILNNDENRIYKKITEYHLTSEKSASLIRQEIDDVKLWFSDFQSKNRNQTDFSPTNPDVMEQEINVRDKLNDLLFIIEQNLKVLRRLQEEYDRQQFEFLLSRMEKQYKNIKFELETFHSTEISIDNFNQLLNPIASTTHQFEKLHAIVFRSESEDLIQIIGYHSQVSKIMPVIGVLISIIFIAFMLQQIKLIITNRDQIKTQLKESEVKFKDFIQGADDLVIQIDNEGIVLFVNSVSEHIFGKKSESCVGINFFECVHSDDREKTESILLDKSNEKLDSASLENRVIHTDGKISDMLWTINYHYDEKDELLFTNSIARNITERNKIETSLLASEKRFETFMDHIPGAAYIKDESGKYVYTNSGFQRVVKETLGIDETDWIGKYDADFLPEQSVNQIRANDEEVLSSGRLKKTVEMVSGEHGITYWLSYSFPIILDEGKEKFLASMSINITEQKTAVDDLTVSEFNFKKAQEMAHVGSWDLDLLTNTLNWSDEVYRIFGLAPQEFGATYEAFIEAIHPDDREMVNEAYLNSVENNTPYEVVHRVLRPNGEVRIVREKSEEVFDLNGKAIRSVGTVHDITELEETTRRLEKERNHFDKLLESLGDVVFIMKFREREIERVNSQIKSVFGYESSELVGQSTRILCQNEEDFIEFGKALKEAIKRGDEVVYLKQTFLKKDGKTFPSEVTLSFLKEADEITHVISVVRDVSESKEAERALREAKEKLEERVRERTLELEESSRKIKESLKEKEVLLKEIHHRVKNNLQLISSLLNLQANSIDDEETINLLMDSKNRIMSMSMIHENIYQSENLSDVNIPAYLKTLAMNLMQSYVVDRDKIFLETKIENITLDINRAIPLGLIITELLTNSIQHAFGTSENGKINLELHAKRKNIELIVRDNGSGIPKEYSEGTNESLGLKLVHTLIAQLQANLKINRENGTEYKISFKL